MTSPTQMPGKSRPLSVGFVLQYGEPADGYFPDTLLGVLCADARRAGHRGRVVRVYYDGTDPGRDREVARRLEAWLEAHDVDLVVVDRIPDPAPIVAYLEGHPGAASVLVNRGDSFDVADGVRFVVGVRVGTTRGGLTRRPLTLPDLRAGFASLLSRLAAGEAVAGAPGVAVVRDGGLVPGPPAPAGSPWPYDPVLDQDVVCLEPAPKVVRRALFGDVGCPYAEDPATNPHYAGLDLPEGAGIARLGCAFCAMGGDYQKRPAGEVVAELVERARYLAERTPDLEELVLGDQSALRYLADLVRAARAAGVPPLVWLFAARADAFVRQRRLVEAAIAAAEETGQTVELYLTGFESFCDRELVRYNKGIDADELVASVTAMRELGAAHPGAFEYARARGHSLILWSPWTTLDDLEESLGRIRRHGLAELFDELGRNRLRLYHDLPITHAARRDGALVDRWETGDAGAGRRKGYNPEHPWRFLSPGTRLAYELARRLRERLGTETEPAQLAAAVAFARGRPEAEPGPAAGEVLAAIDRLDASLQALLAPERAAGAPPRGASDRGALVALAGACNNGCAACANRDVWVSDTEAAVAARVDVARATGRPVVLAGREPTIHPAFLALVRRARGADGREVAVVTNGRRFSVPAFAEASVRAGLTLASVKVFGPGPALADAVSRDPGGFEQAVAGVRALVAAGIAGLELRIPLSSAVLDDPAELADLGKRLGADQLRLEVALDAIGLDRLDAAVAAIDRLCARCADLALALEVSPLAVGTRHLDRLPPRR